MMLSLRVIDAESDEVKIDCVPLPRLVGIRLVKRLVNCVPCEIRLRVCKKFAQSFLTGHGADSITMVVVGTARIIRRAVLYPSI
jgi:hypothetical protein